MDSLVPHTVHSLGSLSVDPFDPDESDISGALSATARPPTMQAPAVRGRPRRIVPRPRPLVNPQFPQPTCIGIFRNVERAVYGDLIQRQIEMATAKLGEGDLSKLLHSGDTWEVS